jgi:hypothetical protein
MLRYAIFFIAVNALHVSGGFFAHHQELKLYTQHNIASCWLNLKEYINDPRYHERQIHVTVKLSLLM